MVDIPEHLLKRSQEARAKAQGDAAPAADETPAAEASAETSAEAPAETAPAAEAPAEAAPAAAASSGIPEHLLARSKAARDKSADGSDDAAGGGGTAVAAPPKPAAPAAAPAAGKPAPAAAAAAAVAPARTQRLLAVVKSGSIQTTKKDPVDKVNTWPHLLIGEFVALLAVTAFLVIFSILLNAPLQGQANPSVTPNPSKAPWYFLGLQELLTMFHPMVAGVTIPGMAIFYLICLPYIDRNPATKPSERKFAIAIFTFFLMYWTILTMLGSFFRGPGFNFVWPWESGIFFEF